MSEKFCRISGLTLHAKERPLSPMASVLPLSSPLAIFLPIFLKDRFELTPSMAQICRAAVGAGTASISEKPEFDGIVPAF